MLASLYSAVTVLLAAIFLHERLHAIQWLGIALLLAGVIVTHL
ncbi:MAG: EamA family transporter [Ktedonobacteraceae bacterium]